MSELQRPARVYSYVVAVDGGFSPNPFHGWCTLACCKPRIRATAQPGDLIVGLSSRCERVVYVLAVEEKLDRVDYWVDTRFRAKRPRWDSDDPRAFAGDNCYEPRGKGRFAQLRCYHWDDERDCEDKALKQADLSAKFVLAGREFSYFGGTGPRLPGRLGFLRVTRGHRCRFSPSEVEQVKGWFETLPQGRLGIPAAYGDAEAKALRADSDCGTARGPVCR